MKRIIASAVLAALTCATAAAADAPAGVTFTGAPTSAISSGVALPAATAMFWVSGTPPSAPLGDTKAQAASVFKNIAATLALQGLTLRDVVYLRAYLVADKATGKADVKGWNDAYGEAFNTAANPTKTARSTVIVAGLVNADWLVEVEAFAAYPKR